MAWLEEYREAKIGSFERGIRLLLIIMMMIVVIIFLQEEEILGLEISMEDSHGVTAVDDGDDLPAEGGGGPFGVMSLGDDAIEELPSLAELHDEVDRMAVLKGPFELDDVLVSGEVMHDLHLTADIFEVVTVEEVAGGDGLAGQPLLGVLVGHKVGHAELATPELTPEAVQRPDV